MVGGGVSFGGDGESSLVVGGSGHSGYVSDRGVLDGGDFGGEELPTSGGGGDERLGLLDIFDGSVGGEVVGKTAGASSYVMSTATSTSSSGVRDI